ncbi:hypothetical protein NST54_13435 [Caldifermentibacillus hisashii]|uniref:hypothetical protein n=1 Tax=Caldifermentibacillus hisashii TaxID=996558 RepID=UPI0034D4C0C6
MFYDTNGSKRSTLATTVDLKRASSKVDINGKVGSVWNISSFSQWKRVQSGYILKDFYTRLAVPYKNQKLLDYGPVQGGVSGSTATVGLSGFVPNVSWTFSIGGFKMSDLSSVSSKYGRWKLSPTLINLGPSQLVIKPGIKSSNTSGNFGLQLSQKQVRVGSVQNGTGVVSIFVPDR